MLSEAKRILIAQFFIVGLLFVIPLSPTLKSIFLIGALISILITPTYTKHLKYAVNTLWGRTAVVLFLFTALACLWSPASYAGQWADLSKYLKLIYLPLLAIGFIHPKSRQWAIQSYLLVMLLTCIVSLLQYKRFILVLDPGQVAFNRIVTGFMVAFAAYLAALLFQQQKNWLRVYYLFIVLLASYQVLFINQSRSDYIVYFALLSLFFLQNLSLKQALTGVLIAFGFMCFLATHGTVMKSRVDSIVHDLRAWQHKQPNTSIGYRFQFHEYSKKLFKEHPIRGQGTGGYRQRFTQDNPVPSWGTGTADPHSQYWMTLSEFGAMGFILLWLFLGSLVVSARQLKETRPILLGIVVSFCIISVTDTVLAFSPVGFLLIVFSALSMGELIQKQQE